MSLPLSFYASFKASRSLRTCMITTNKTPWEYTEEFLTWYKDHSNSPKALQRDQLWEAWKVAYSIGYRQGRGVA